MNRDQQRAVRAWGSWQALDALMGTLTEAPIGGSTTTRGLWPEGHRQWHDGKGVRIETRDGEQIVKVTWAQIRKHGKALPAELRDRIAAVRRQGQRLAMQGHRQFTLSPGYAYMRTEADKDRHELTHEQADALRERLEPLWHAAHQLIAAETTRLLDEALPLACDDDDYVIREAGEGR